MTCTVSLVHSCCAIVHVTASNHVSHSKRAACQLLACLIPGCKEEAELNNVLKTCIMVRRLKRDVLAQLPPKRRTQARPDQALSCMLHLSQAPMHVLPLHLLAYPKRGRFR